VTPERHQFFSFVKCSC